MKYIGDYNDIDYGIIDLFEEENVDDRNIEETDTKDMPRNMTRINKYSVIPMVL